MNDSQKTVSVVITGASSGIGRAIALLLANSHVTLYLSGRNSVHLDVIAQECLSRGAEVKIKLVDVCDRRAMDNWIKSIGHLDWVLACAGVSAGTVNQGKLHSVPEDAETTRQIMQTNIDGVLNTILPAIEIMQQQSRDREDVRGRVAVIASVAAFLNSSWAPSYCASKAAVDRLVVSLGGSLEREGIYLSSICCGFIKTPMTSHNHFMMPGMMTAEKAASLIIKGVVAKKRRIIFPIWMAIIARILDLLPAGFLEKIYLHYLEKKEHK